jgi:excisionase family DNA binding protein
MTGKQAVKERCRDCLAGSRECVFAECALKGMAKGKGKVKASAIKTYCRWCLNGNAFTVCSSSGCAIYQVRKERGDAKNTPSLRENRGYRGGYEVLHPKSRTNTRQGQAECKKQRFTGGIGMREVQDATMNNRITIQSGNGQEITTEATMEQETLIDVKQAAKALCLSVATVRKWVQLKSIPYRKMGRAVRFSPLELKAWGDRKSV